MKKTKIRCLLLCFQLIFLSIILFGSISSAQTPHFVWATGIEGGAGGNTAVGLDIAVDSEGNSIVTGFIQGTVTFGNTTLTCPSGRDIILAKYDKNGNLIWVKQAGGSGGINCGNAVAVDEYDNIFITGEYNWTINIGTIQLTNMVAGVAHDVFTAKFNSAGSVLWAKPGGGNRNDDAVDIACDINGNVVIAGYFASDNIRFDTQTFVKHGTSWRDIFIVKYSPSGNLSWAKGLGSTGDDQGFGIATDPENILVTGYYGGTVDFGGTQLTFSGTNQNVFIAKYHSNGSLIWVKNAETNSAKGWAITSNNSKDVFVLGEFAWNAKFGSYNLTAPSPEYIDLFIVKYDANGNVQWARGDGSGGGDDALDIVADESGNCYISTDLAWEEATFGNIEVQNCNAIVKYDYQGNVPWVKEIDRGAEPDALAFQEGRIFVTGDVLDFTASFDDIVISNGLFVAALDLESVSYITVTSPNGGEVWYVGEWYNITWESDSYVGTVKIEISTNGGSSWWDVTQGRSTPNDGRYGYTPNTVSDNCLFRITSDENPSVRDQSDAAFTVQNRDDDNNMIVNGDFSDGVTAWVFYSHAPASATSSVINEEYVVNITSGGTANWHVQLNQYDLNIENGKSYLVMFDARASAGRTIYTSVGENGSPWTNYSAYEQFAISTTNQTYSYSFVMSEPTDSGARLTFDMGLSDVDVFLDNIILKQIKSTSFWADVDADGDVDIIDIQLVAAHWNTKVGDPNYDAKYDVDNEGQGDGDIDIIDIQLVAAWWNKPLPPVMDN